MPLDHLGHSLLKINELRPFNKERQFDLFVVMQIIRMDYDLKKCHRWHSVPRYFQWPEQFTID